MQYHNFGNTGVKVSALGFGAMRLPEEEIKGKYHIREEESIEIIQRAFELGGNLIPDDKVCQKNPPAGGDEWRGLLGGETP